MPKVTQSFTHACRRGAGRWQWEGQQDRCCAAFGGGRQDESSSKRSKQWLLNWVHGSGQKLAGRLCDGQMREERVDLDTSAKLGVSGEGMLKVKSEGCKCTSRAM